MFNTLPDSNHEAPAELRSTIEEVLRENNSGILSDTLHFETLSLHQFSGSLLSPGRVYEALKNGGLGYILTAAAIKGIDACNDADGTKTRQDCISTVVEYLFLELATSIGHRVQGPCIVYIDPRNHNSTELMVAAAQRMHHLFREKGVSPESIIVSIPATEAGIRAVQVLQPQGILTNLYLVTSLVHAALCVEAKTAALSVAVGPLLAAYEQRANTVYSDINKHPGMDTIRTLLKYFEMNEIPTKVLGTAFRSLEEVGQLSAFDAVCITDKQANRMKWSTLPCGISKDTPRHLEGERRIEFRAKQAKYPTDLLTTHPARAFATWFSPDSRKVTMAVMDAELHLMKGQMDAIQRYVEAEFDRQTNLRATKTWTVGYREGSPGLQWRAFRGEMLASPFTTPTPSPSRARKPVRSPAVKSDVPFPAKKAVCQEEQDMDDVF